MAGGQELRSMDGVRKTKDRSKKKTDDLLT